MAAGQPACPFGDSSVSGDGFAQISTNTVPSALPIFSHPLPIVVADLVPHGQLGRLASIADVRFECQQRGLNYENIARVGPDVSNCPAAPNPSVESGEKRHRSVDPSKKKPPWRGLQVGRRRPWIVWVEPPTQGQCNNHGRRALCTRSHTHRRGGPRSTRVHNRPSNARSDQAG